MKSVRKRHKALRTKVTLYNRPNTVTNRTTLRSTKEKQIRK